ncbi:PSP1 domain-containing protein [Clostridium cellulovorans]|uniref:PSP1 domain protein n=1 Tax=Clostridium cellulovorans (strain ATCC 35296 / DSM 3052 / OCM 3 / 743B) TaxID=573061 RepID=D9SNM0_CLOC7|nr:stage 0 sporulation family protein [Clostridium cellulovorans]ADL49891.1 PSP1 domain protein [Clostridium cellulovorans 743B]
MIEVVGVRFKKAGKVYYFSPGDLDIKEGDDVIVETARGLEFGNCIIGHREVSEEDIISPLKSVVRVATPEDVIKYEENKKAEEEAFGICLEKIDKHELVMKLIDVEYTFDNNKIIFYFTAEGRVDFRELVKDLATIFRTRIELRQIGVRDEAKMLGGVGPCGRPLCCTTFLGDFAPVSIKMAKEQNLSLNPSKISGICGRLMCCLNYEQETYEKTRRIMPTVGSIVETAEGRGEIISSSIVKEKVTIKVTPPEGEWYLLEAPIVGLKLISGSYEGTVDEKDIKLEVEDAADVKVIKELFKTD